MIYVFLAVGFEEIEALTAVDILRRADLDVKVAGVGGINVTGSHGITVVCDCEVTEIRPGESLEAIVLPGGMPGTLNLEKSPAVHSFIDYAFENGKLICAICAAPSILGHKGLLEGKKAVCFPSFEKDLQGALIPEDFVVRDGKIITAKGPGVSVGFALKIAEYFIGEQKTASLQESLQI